MKKEEGGKNLKRRRTRQIRDKEDSKEGRGSKKKKEERVWRDMGDGKRQGYMGKEGERGRGW